MERRALSPNIISLDIQPFNILLLVIVLGLLEERTHKLPVAMDEISWGTKEPTQLPGLEALVETVSRGCRG
jgi:hypothetical protein